LEGDLAKEGDHILHGLMTQRERRELGFNEKPRALKRDDLDQKLRSHSIVVKPCREKALETTREVRKILLTSSSRTAGKLERWGSRGGSERERVYEENDQDASG